MSYALGSNCSEAIWFEEKIDPVRPMADIAVANLAPIATGAFAGGAVPAATWQAQSGENLENFKDRIRAALATAQTTGVGVTVYWRCGFWQRNTTCNAANLLPVG